MSTVAIGKRVKAFKVAATGNKIVNSNELKGSKIVLYFYPKDATPGCTVEGQDFRDSMEKFKRAGAVVLGVSRDNMESHERFREKQHFNFDLLSDTDESLCAQFEVIKEKNMYGKQVMGIERSTFLIDADGILRQEWRKVTVAGHVLEVLAAVKVL